MTSTEELKRAAAYHAAAWIEDGMVVGLGTGSTVRHLLDAIAERRRRGELQDVVGIPTSEDTRRRAEALRIPTTDLTARPAVDLALDGADEFDPSLDLIKGLGGALLREKLVAIAAATFVALVDESKRVDRLGTKAPLPVEVDAFGVGIQEPFLRALGCTPQLRCMPGGAVYRTDGGNLILDCHFAAGIEDPHSLAEELDRRPGILEHGLFLDLAGRVVVAAEGGVQVLERGRGDR
jgi:ribose 5-phosphate isomerase A